VTDATQLAQSGEAARCSPLHMSTHHQMVIKTNNHIRRSDTEVMSKTVPMCYHNSLDYKDSAINMQESHSHL